MPGDSANWRFAYEALIFVKNRMLLGSSISIGVEAAELMASPIPIGPLLEGPGHVPMTTAPVVGQVMGALKIIQGQAAKYVIRKSQNTPAHQDMEQRLAASPTDPGLKELNVALIAASADKARAGNCGEQSSMAFIYLRDHDCFPIDIMRWGNSFGKYGGHAFVTIGRDAGSPAADPRRWGEDCVVCDPQKTGMVFGANLANHYFGEKTYESYLRMDTRSQYTKKVFE